MDYYAYEGIQKLFLWDNKRKKIIGGILFLGSALYSSALFFGKDVLNYFSIHPILTSLCAVLKNFILIGCVLGIAKAIDGVNFFTRLGQNTLYLCGSEYIVKLLLPLFLQLAGGNLTLKNPLTSYIYTFVLLVVTYYLFVPVEKMILKKLTNSTNTNTVETANGFTQDIST